MKKQPKSNKKASTSFMRLALESRLLFDGAVVATAAQVVDDKAAQDQAQDINKDASVDAAPDAVMDAAHSPAAFGDLMDTKTVEQQPQAITAAASAGSKAAPALIVIDLRAEGSGELFKNPPPNTDVRALDTSRDGYQQIADILQERGDTTDLQILTADIAGKQWLSASQVASSLSAANSGSLIDWGDGLSADANIVFHSQDTINNTWLNHVNTLTGGKVNSSQDMQLNGHPELIDGVTEAVALTDVTHTLVFIDTTVKDYQTLRKDIDPNATVIFLNPNTDEVEQIAQVISQYDNLQAIHIISHGSDGQLNLGSSVLDNVSLQGKYADELAVIGQHLSADADILVYGCDVAEGERGQAFVAALATATGADVAASTNTTGAAALGGDWILESSTGAIQAVAIRVDTWQNVLAVPTLDLNGATAGTNSSINYTENQAATAIVPLATVSDTDNDLRSLKLVGNAAVANGNAEILVVAGQTVLLGANFTGSAIVGSTNFNIGYTAATKTLLINNSTAGNIPNADMQALIRGITYQHTSDSPGAGNRIFAITTTDSNGSTTVTRNATVVLTRVNDAPTATITPLNYSATEQTNLILHGTGLSVADVDAGVATNIVATLSVGEGTLTVVRGSSGVTVGGSGSSSVTLRGSVTQINSLLASLGGATGTVTYRNNFDAPSASTLLTLSVNDAGNTGTGGVKTGSDTATINLTAVNDAPILDLNAGAAGNNGTAIFTEQTPILIAPIGTLIDADSANIVSLRATLTTRPNGNAVESLSLNTAAATAASGLAVSYSPTTGILSITGTATKAIYQSILQGILYNNTSDTPTTANRTVNVIVNDGALNSISRSIAISMTALNDAPTATITPLSYSATEQTNLILHRTGLSIADVDAGVATNIVTTLSVGEGALTVVPGSSGVTVAGSGTASVTLTGRVTQINSLLASLGGATGTIIYQNNLNAPSASTLLTLSVNDAGNTGTGGAKTGSDTATINITAVNDAPVAVNDLASTLEDIPVTILVLTNDTDVDTPNAALTIASVTNGTGGTAVLNANGTVTFTPNLNFNGTADFTYTISDGLLSSNTATVTIDVASVIDIETVTLSSTAPASVVEGSTITYTASVANPVTGTPLVLTLSNGQTITIPVGATTGTVDFAVRPDDTLIQGTVALPAVTITANSGGNFETVTTTGTVNTSVIDDADPSAVTLSSTASASVVEGSTITYTATVASAVTDTPLVVTLSNGQAVTIPVGATTGTVDFAVRPDDTLIQGTVALPAVTITANSGGNFETVTTTGTVNTSVIDDADPTAVTLSSSAPATVVEGAAITYTATVASPVTDTPLVVTLSNGQAVTIPVGATTGTVDFAVRPDDTLIQGTVALPEVSITATSGGNFEALATAGTVNTSVSDDANDKPKPSAKIDNIGALILLSNPTPPLFPTSTDNSYSLLPFREPRLTWNGYETYSPSRLSLYGDLQDHDLYLTGTLRNQVVQQIQAYSFSIPLGTFRHTNPNERLEYQATQGDGSPLPKWLDFNPKTLKFSGIPPNGALTIEVIVKAKDGYGKEAFATFKVVVKESSYDSNRDEPKPRNNHESKISGKTWLKKSDKQNTVFYKSSFTEQLNVSGKLSRLMESRALIDSLTQL